VNPPSPARAADAQPHDFGPLPKQDDGPSDQSDLEFRVSWRLWKSKCWPG
jgi:hypothetical protein